MHTELPGRTKIECLDGRMSKLRYHRMVTMGSGMECNESCVVEIRYEGESSKEKLVQIGWFKNLLDCEESVTVVSNYP